MKNWENIARKDAEKIRPIMILGMDNHFYNTQLKERFGKGYQKLLTFSSQGVLNDLQLVLDQFAKSRSMCSSCFQPVNKKWMDYTGLVKCINCSVEKIRYQLESQEFHNILVFKNGDEPYFVKDTIHIDWLSWLAFDKVVKSFFE